MPTGRRTVLICLLSLFAGGGLAHAAAPVPTPASTPSRIPPGFEYIALGQVEHLDIRWLGQSLGVFPVFVRPDDVRLETPEAVASVIGARVALAPETSIRLVEALGTPMSRNGHLACDDTSQHAGCRYLEPESAGVIFDERQGQLELFFARAWLPSDTVSGPSYRANSPGSERALIHSQIVNASTTDRYRNLTVMGHGALGISPASYAGFAWSLVHTSYGSVNAAGHGDPGEETSPASTSIGGTRARIDSLYYRHDIGTTHYVQTGRMDQRNLFSAQGGSFGFTLLPVARFDGARIGTSMAYVNEDTHARGSQLTVLLTREARVDAYRGNELLGSSYFQAGVQSFDTRHFPEGAYLVTLRIFEGDALVRTQSEPYAKVGSAAFAQGTQWFFQTGRPVGEPGAGNAQDRERFTVQTGMRTVLGHGMSVSSGFVWLPARVYNETQIDWQQSLAFGRLTAAAALLTGTDGARGDTQSVSFSNGIGLSLYRYRMRGAGCRHNGNSVDIGCYDSLSANVSVPLSRWQGNAGYTQSRQYGRRSTHYDVQHDDISWPQSDLRNGMSRTAQATLSRTFRWRKLSIGARVGAYHRRYADAGRPDMGAFLSVSASAHRPATAGRSASTYTSAGTDVRSGSSDDRRGRADVFASHTWSWDDTSRRELTLGLSGSEIGLKRLRDAMGGEGGGTASVRGVVDGRYGDVHAMLSRSFGRGGAGESKGSFTGGYASSLAVTRERVWFGPAMLGSEPPAAVGLVVDAGEGAGVEGEAHDDEHVGAAATLQIGGRPQTIGFGASAFAPIGGYRVQPGEIFEAREGVTNYAVGLLRGAGVHDYFLTPGRMKVHRVTAARSYTYVGRALGPDGLSLANARVLSVSASPLDDRGEFLIESPHRLTELYLLDGTQPMRCDIRVIDRRDVIYLSGQTQCEIVAQQALPEALQAQAHVQRLLGDATSRRDRQAGLEGALRYR
ncbi:TcfC E-set like domain-containing protein [Pandoraea sputorum]|uniref:TcfC E-set like domain-containing protein n=1 Tax=Pandoraea sputorum TaxID=93222 RepID=UPI001E425893|nr:TcfC E-set like domain-containing protein [Pandoraea sputorum]MCE4062077.1 TcfC E-set like domain-containing protein [Pandoraea sputorum]